MMGAYFVAASKAYLVSSSRFFMDQYLATASRSFDGKGLIPIFRKDYEGREILAKSALEPATADFSSNAALFTLAMHQHSISLAPVILEKYKDLTGEWGFSSFLDVAGGSAVIWYVSLMV